jgi:hypothetical protein
MYYIMYIDFNRPIIKREKILKIVQVDYYSPVYCGLPFLCNREEHKSE